MKIVGRLSAAYASPVELRPVRRSKAPIAGTRSATVVNPYATAVTRRTWSVLPWRKPVMPTKVSAGRMADAQPIAGDGLRADRAAYSPIPPPTMTARNGAG